MINTVITDVEIVEIVPDWPIGGRLVTYPRVFLLTCFSAAYLVHRAPLSPQSFREESIAAGKLHHQDLENYTVKFATETNSANKHRAYIHYPHRLCMKMELIS